MHNYGLADESQQPWTVPISVNFIKFPSWEFELTSTKQHGISNRFFYVASSDLHWVKKRLYYYRLQLMLYVSWPVLNLCATCFLRNERLAFLGCTKRLLVAQQLNCIEMLIGNGSYLLMQSRFKFVFRWCLQKYTFKWECLLSPQDTRD